MSSCLQSNFASVFSFIFPGIGGGLGFSFCLVGPLGPSPGGTSLVPRRIFCMGFLRMDAQKWPYGCGFGAQISPFTVFLRIFSASHGLNLRFDCKFTWNSMGVDGFEVLEFAI